eukprot:1221340-Rhodomonas_salina.3
MLTHGALPRLSILLLSLSLSHAFSPTSSFLSSSLSSVSKTPALRFKPTNARLPTLAPTMSEKRPEGATPLKFKPVSALVNGFLAASLILGPGLQVFNSPFISAGGDAYAQGATSRKSTRGAPSTDANKDPESVLRLALPIPNGNPIREAQVRVVFLS